MRDISVVILNFNGEKLLREFLPSVVKYSNEADIYVADNGSSDGSIAILRQMFPQVGVISFSVNHGFCKGYNEALRQMQSRICILLNSDVMVTQDWLVPIARLFEDHPDIDAVQPKILSYREPEKFEYAGAGGGLLDSMGYPFCRGRIFERIEHDNGQYDDEREVFWASGACMAIRAEAYHNAGGFDEDFFAHMEEIDLCWKIQRSGRKVFYTGRSTVYHLGAGTLGYGQPGKTYLNFRNNLSMLIKHLDRGELILKLPARMILDWIAALAFILKGRSANAMAILKAHTSIVKSWSQIVRKRKALRARFPDYPRRNIYRGLILFRYWFGKYPS